MKTLAATLGGASRNQDRYVVGDNFAAVLDGATSVAGDRSHDPGWFAQQLADSLARTIPEGGPLADHVERAIRTVRDTHALQPDSAPTSTIAIARWSRDALETYVLGDSPAVVLHPDGTASVHEDDRLAAVATAKRTTYRSQLAAGHGYGQAHRETLLDLQAEQAERRNRPGGYWIAGTDPDAAQHGITDITALSDVAAVILASDGVALERHPNATTWAELLAEVQQHGPDNVLRSIHGAEDADPDGSRWPRSKPHDDKTIVIAIPS
ncbi:protein phosphatase 2C-like protein [Promicromonospora sp. AC04]|uniref:protein phosphatase 2C domain-containing protein n=1 Tax=Promicromonospora sp. AC04 TaxID=2135723 RepID=UPI000D3D113B|nr:protein phosphatase 2C domain-containing protein [Promicromonospora sp. AC04]PUB23964.1 protein phosphatase 2C-like protein [Promicromonospora sp. AC04]